MRIKVLCFGLLFFVLPQAHAIVISEVLYDPIGSDSAIGDGFIELYGMAGSSLNGFSVVGINGTTGQAYLQIDIVGNIPSDGVFVIADTDANGATQVANADFLFNFDFQNGADSIQLLQMGVVIDALGYGDFSTGAVFAGEGQAAADAVNGESLMRIFADVDNQDNAMDFAINTLPNPGQADLASVPVPAAAWLFASGLVMLLRKKV